MGGHQQMIRDDMRRQPALITGQSRQPDDKMALDPVVGRAR